MATVTRPAARRFDLQTANRQVRDPLHKLRGYIRRYVILHAVTSLVICLAAWFWISLFLDYASFQLLTFDWVQDMPRGFRAFMTGGAIFLVWFFVEIRKIIGRHPLKKARPSALDQLIANKPLLWGITASAAVVWLTGFIVAAYFVTNGVLVG